MQVRVYEHIPHQNIIYIFEKNVKKDEEKSARNNRLFEYNKTS